MNEEIKKAWQAKLATEPQTTGRLCELFKDGNVRGYCCWGLYLEVLKERGLVTSTDDTSSNLDRAYRTPDGIRTTTYPTTKMLELAEIPQVVAGTDSVVHFLAQMNDEGSNFVAISNVIEELL